MHDSLIPNWTQLRKSLKKNPWQGFDNYCEAVKENRGCGEWTRKEMISMEADLLGSINPEQVIPDRYLEYFRHKGWDSMDNWVGKGIYWFIVTDTKPRLTKNKKPYLQIFGMGRNGKAERMNCWGWNGSEEIEQYSICLAIIDQNDYGKSCRWSKLQII